jgi:hypothetical protein
MSYTLNWKNPAIDPINKQTVVVNVGTVDSTSTPLSLTGKGAANYGGLQQENLLHMLENFADTVPPAHATIGQLWFDYTTKTLKVLASTSPITWKALTGVEITGVGSLPPASPNIGNLWFSTTGSASGILYVYTGIGRYPSTGTVIGGWDQIYPQVEIFAGRDDYDEVRQLIDRLAGNPVSAFGSGAISRAVPGLTDFASLDNDFRLKYKVLPSDSNVLYSPNTGISSDREITKQATSSTLFYFVDSITASDGFIGGESGGVPSPTTNGSILINNSPFVLPFGTLKHSKKADDAFILYDHAQILNPTLGRYLVARQIAPFGTWEYDNDAGAWVPFIPLTQMYAIGSISTAADDDAGDLIYPNDLSAVMWAHAVPLVGTKFEHLKVEPNSQDWDLLLSAAKYAVNRLEVPSTFVTSISGLPFVSDGRPVPASLLGLNAGTDVRYPSAARRSSRKASVIGQVRSFTETVNVLNTAIANKFSIKGINGATGSNPNFAANTALLVHCAPPVVGLSNVVATGHGSAKVNFRFTTISDLNRFLASGGGIQVEVSHAGGALAGDTNFRALLAAVGTWRLTADKTRFFDQTSPASPTMTRNIVNVGIWNGTPTGMTLATQTLSGCMLTMKVTRASNTQFDVTVEFDTASPLAGTTSLTFRTISDTETYVDGVVVTDVYTKPLAFDVGDLTGLTDI